MRRCLRCTAGCLSVAGLLLLVGGCAGSEDGADDSAAVAPSPPVTLEDRGSEIKRDDGTIIEITFRLNKVSDDQLQDISQFERLQSLTIQECADVTDGALREIGRLGELRALRISRAPVTDQGLEHLKRLRNLRVLWLQNTNVAGTGLEQLAVLPLESLRLAGKTLTGEGLQHLRDFTALRELHVNSPKLDVKDLPSLLTLRELRELNLNNVRIDDDSVARFAGLPKLQRVEFDERGIGDEGLAQLAACPDLESLNLSRSQVTDAGLSVLARHERLKSIALGGRNTDAALRHFAKLASLERIDAVASQISGAELPQLSGLTNLELVDLDFRHVTSEGRAGAQALKQAQPQCTIWAWRGDSAIELGNVPSGRPPVSEAVSAHGRPSR